MPTKKSIPDVEILENFHIIHHVLIDHKLCYLRDPRTHIKEFNRLLKEISMLMMYEITKDFPSETRSIKTEFGEVSGRVVAGKKAVLVPILRAGLIMVEGIKEITGSFRIGHLGLHRNRITNEVIEYLVHLPPAETRTFIIVDPIIMTGETACEAIRIVNEHGVRLENIKFMSLLVSKQGMAAVQKRYSTVQVYAASVDFDLENAEGIVPGVGYIGERLYGSA